MSCEHLAEKINEHAQSLPNDAQAKKPLAALAYELVINCTPYKRSHTASILASLSGDDPKIPNYLKKHPEAQQILIDNGIIDEVLV